MAWKSFFDGLNSKIAYTWLMVRPIIFTLIFDVKKKTGCLRWVKFDSFNDINFSVSSYGTLVSQYIIHWKERCQVNGTCLWQGKFLPQQAFKLTDCPTSHHQGQNSRFPSCILSQVLFLVAFTNALLSINEDFRLKYGMYRERENM